MQGVYETLVGFGAEGAKTHVTLYPQRCTRNGAPGFLWQDTTEYDGVDEISFWIPNHSLQDNCRRDNKDER